MVAAGSGSLSTDNSTILKLGGALYRVPGTLMDRLAGKAHYTEYFTPGSYTWVKPALATVIEVILMGGGGGGGSGRNASPLAAVYGGHGGHPGCVTVYKLLASSLGSTVSVIVGAGGPGGSAQAVAGPGVDGGEGGYSSFGEAFASGGEGNFGGLGNSFTYSTRASALFTNAVSLVSNGAAAGGNTAAASSVAVAGMPTGGGGGGGLNMAMTAASAAGMPGIPVCFGTPALAGVQIVSPITTPGQEGSYNPDYFFGTGGAGGSSFTNANGQSGGNGVRGGGGGGGGACASGYVSGAGGNGGNGCVLVIAY